MEYQRAVKMNKLEVLDTTPRNIITLRIIKKQIQKTMPYRIPLIQKIPNSQN